MQALLRLWHALESCPWHATMMAEWEEVLGSDVALVRPHLRPTGELSSVMPCTSPGGEGCPRHVHDRGGGTFEAVCGNLPQECPPLKLKKSALAVLALDRAAALAPLLANLCEQECLAVPEVAAEEGVLPLGTCSRRGERILVVLASPEAQQHRLQLRELRAKAGAAALIVLVQGKGEDAVVEPGLARLSLDTGASELKLWRAVRLLYPESWGGRAKAREALFEEVQLELASIPGERHLVRLNGVELKDFRTSDQRFARLLVLAAARVKDRDVEAGGWVKKVPTLQVDERENDVTDLRKAFVAEQDDGFASLTVEERRALVQSSTERPGLLRLPLHPLHIRFDESLRGLRFISDKQPEAPPKPAKSAKLVRNQEQSRRCTLELLATARSLGVPLPSQEELLAQEASSQP